VKGLRAEGCHQGVTIFNSDDNVIEDSVLTYNQEGMYVLSGSDRNIIRRNIVLYNGLGTTGGRDGIAVGGNGAGSDNLIDGNIVAFNGQIGIGVFDAPRTAVRNNHVYRNGGTGIHLGVNSVNSLYR
jgi:parallel beta-helix repeat protein